MIRGAFAVLLDHVEDLLCSIQPDIMVWYGHGLEGDLLGIFKVRVRPPDLVQPFNREKLVLSCHVLWQAK